MAKKNNFGGRLRKARIKKGLRQNDLADMVGVSHSSICGYEKSINYPGFDVMAKIAKALEVDMDYLILGEELAHHETYSESDKEFITKYRSLPEETQEYVFQLIELMYAHEKKAPRKIVCGK